MKKDPIIFIEHIATDLSNLPNCQLLYSRDAINWSIICVSRYILDSINKIEEYLRNVQKNIFLKDTKIQDAVIRRIEVIGEAVKNLPSELTARYPQIEWKKIAGTRDKIMHLYFGVDLDIIWEIVEKDLPVLKTNLLKIKHELVK